MLLTRYDILGGNLIDELEDALVGVEVNFVCIAGLGALEIDDRLHGRDDLVDIADIEAVIFECDKERLVSGDFSFDEEGVCICIGFVRDRIGEIVEQIGVERLPCEGFEISPFLHAEFGHADGFGLARNFLR